MLCILSKKEVCRWFNLSISKLKEKIMKNERWTEKNRSGEKNQANILGGVLFNITSTKVKDRNRAIKLSKSCVSEDAATYHYWNNYEIAGGKSIVVAYSIYTMQYGCRAVAVVPPRRYGQKNKT